MITLDALYAAQSMLSGDAVKVAIVLMRDYPEATEMHVDLSWRSQLARELFLHVKIVERSLKELSDAGLCELQRVTLRRLGSSSMSERGVNLRAPSSSMSEAKRGEAASEASCRSSDASSSTESAQASSLQLASEQPAAEKREGSRARKGRHALASPVDSADVRACIDVFDQHYRDANGGAKPTWGASQYVAVRQLVEKHGASEVQKRIRVMFTAPPRFPPPPYDLRTLVQHFDKFAQPSGKGGMIDRWATGESYYGGGQS